jgi:hypothetical protein
MKASFKTALTAALLILGITPILADNNLFSLEIQGAGSYRSATDELVWFTHHQHEAMQKPSAGFDYITRFRSAGADRGYLSIQARLSYNEEREWSVEPQLYNAFYNFKIMRSDLRIGHFKTALGISSYFDNHALIMPDNTMTPLNFDRDWGIGFYSEREYFDFYLTFTAGSGMPLYVKDNYFISARAGFWDLERDNVNAGISFASGQILKTMGYEYMHGKMNHEVLLGGFDAHIRYLNTYLLTDMIAGEYHNNEVYALLIRSGINFLQEDRINFEIQTQMIKSGNISNEIYTAGLAYKVNPYITFRTAFSKDFDQPDHILIMQLYYLKGFVF